MWSSTTGVVLLCVGFCCCCVDGEMVGKCWKVLEDVGGYPRSLLLAPSFLTINLSPLTNPTWGDT